MFLHVYYSRFCTPRKSHKIQVLRPANVRVRYPLLSPMPIPYTLGFAPPNPSPSIPIYVIYLSDKYTSLSNT